MVDVSCASCCADDSSRCCRWPAILGSSSFNCCTDDGVGDAEEEKGVGLLKDNAALAPPSPLPLLPLGGISEAAGGTIPSSLLALESSCSCL